MPVRLAQGSKEGLEAGTVELGPRGLGRVVRRRAVRHEFLASILKVLRKFLDDLAFTRGRQTQRRKVGTHVPPPIRHVPLA